MSFWIGVTVGTLFAGCAACTAAVIVMCVKAPPDPDEPVPYVLDDLAATVMCIACAAVRQLGDLAHVVECACTADCGEDGCQGGKLPRRQTSATWNDDDMDILDGKRLP